MSAIDPFLPVTGYRYDLNSRVTATGSGTVTLPFSDNSFFVPNGTGTNNANSFLTAIFSGVMTLPIAETVNFTFSADDDMFLFVDGQSFSHSSPATIKELPTIGSFLGAIAGLVGVWAWLLKKFPSQFIDGDG